MSPPLRALRALALVAPACLAACSDGTGPAPPTAPGAAGYGLAAVQRLAPERVLGPEDLAFDAAGELYAGTAEGEILRLPATGAPARVHARTGGRPLGLAFDLEGRLLVADALRGLLAVGSGGEVTVLATGEGGLPFRFTNGVAVGPSGAVYFTDASSRHGPAEILEEMLERGPHGRLLRYDPATGAVSRLLGGLHFANGVAVAPDGTYLLVAETSAFRITRYWLEGPRAGQAGTFLDDLPGFPDGISHDGAGVFWLALFAPRGRLLDALAAWPALGRLVLRLPAGLLPEPERHTRVLGLDADGRVVHDLRDPLGRYAPVSSVRQRGDLLYLGSLTERGIGRVPAPARAR